MNRSYKNIRFAVVSVLYERIDVWPGFTFDGFTELASALRCSPNTVRCAVTRSPGDVFTCVGVTFCRVENYEAVCKRLNVPIEELI